MDTATIFYVDEQFLRRDDNPWGVRFDAQTLPHGSVVVGFMQWNTRTQTVDELLVDGGWPLHKNQEQSWQDVLKEAREYLEGVKE